MIYIGNDNNITLKVGTETVTAAYMGTEQVYPNVVPPIDYSMMYFTTEAIDDTVIHLSENLTSFEVSKDNGQTWTTTGSYPGIFNLGLLAGEKAYWRCSQPLNNSSSVNPQDYGIAHMDGTYRFKVYGNIMSLFWDDNFEDKTVFPGSSRDYVYGLRHFFKNATTLVDVQNLVIPVTEEYLCSRMFDGCSNLVNAPQLPATTLAFNCYGYMFNGCTSLTTAPVLPATTLVQNCYGYMFNGCSSLNNITCLATDISATGCTNYWVENVAATGTFTKPLSMSSWTNGINGIPDAWTTETYLEEKPFLPTTTFTPQGYVTFIANTDNSAIGLLRESTNQTMYFSKNGTDWMTLNGEEKMSMNNGDTYYCCGMLSGNNTNSDYTQFYMKGSIAASGNCNAIWDYSDLNAALKSSCGTHMFDGCTSLTTAPVLPATTLVSRCYNYMFQGCTNLNYIKAMFTTKPTGSTITSSTYNWVSGVSQTGTFVKNIAATWTNTGTYAVPTGWTIETATE